MEEKVLIRVPSLNNLEVVLDFSELEETKQYIVEYEECEFTEEQIQTEVKQFVESVLEAEIEEIKSKND